MSMNPYARFEYREDRFDLARWLKAPRRGYRTTEIMGSSADGVRLDKQYTDRGDPNRRVCCDIRFADLQSAPHGCWRLVVADNLREMRRFIHDRKGKT